MARNYTPVVVLIDGPTLTRPSCRQAETGTLVTTSTTTSSTARARGRRFQASGAYRPSPGARRRTALEAPAPRARTLLASTKEGGLVFDPFSGFGTKAVAAKELGRFFVGAGLDEGFAGLAARRVAATERGSLLHEISERFWTDAESLFV